MKLLNFLTGGIIEDLTLQRNLYSDKVRELYLEIDNREKLFERYRRRARMREAYLRDENRKLKFQIELMENEKSN